MPNAAITRSPCPERSDCALSHYTERSDRALSIALSAVTVPSPLAGEGSAGVSANSIWVRGLLPKKMLFTKPPPHPIMTPGITFMPSPARGEGTSTSASMRVPANQSATRRAQPSPRAERSDCVLSHYTERSDCALSPRSRERAAQACRPVQLGEGVASQKAPLTKRPPSPNHDAREILARPLPREERAHQRAPRTHHACATSRSICARMASSKAASSRSAAGIAPALRVPRSLTSSISASDRIS